MDLDLFDVSDDAANKVRAGAKFQPRAKPRLPRRASAAPLAPCSQKLGTTDQSPEAEKPSDIDEQRSSAVVNPTSENGGRTSILESVVDLVPDLHGLVADGNENWQTCFEKSAGENSDIFIGLESFGDFMPDSASVSTVPSSEVLGGHIPSSRDAEKGFSDPLIHDDDLCYSLHNPAITPQPQMSPSHDPLIGDEQESRLFPPESDFVIQGSVPAFVYDVAPDVSSVGPGHMIPAEAVSDVLVDDGQRINMASSNSDAEVLGNNFQTGPNLPEKLASRRARNAKSNITAPDHYADCHGASTSNQTGVARRSLRKRHNPNTLHQLVDEPEDERADGNLQAESPGHSSENREGNDSEPQTKKVREKSNKAYGENKKRVRKCKKGNEVSDEIAKAPKKFSHSTRRRKVDKALLENPDNVDVQKVPLRDLILLAEYKERMVKKGATTSQEPPDQSTTNYAARDTEDGAGYLFQEYDEGDNFASEQVGLDDEESGPMAEESSSFFNYHTFMKKTPVARWSKEDTELFYEGVQQFGTDLSMIQQLFPGRTRRQVKLKYKKEEKEHPLRLRDALTNRSKGHSHFELVIDRLRQIAAEEKQNTNKEDSNTEEHEDALESRDGEATSVQIDEEVLDKEPEVPEEQSPVKSHDSEDELYRWSQYKSEF